MQPDRDQFDTPQNSQPSVASTPQTEPQRGLNIPLVTLTPDTSQTPLALDPMTMEQPETQDAGPSQVPQPSPEPIRWQGTEYIHHEKDVLWFVLFGIVVVALMSLAVFVLKSITFSILIPVMAVSLIVYTRRPPRLIDYTLSAKGLYVNDQLYSFTEFKGFGVIRDGQEFSVMLIPTKRFKLGVSVYFPEEAGEAIVDILGARLPMREMHLDLFDQIIHKLRI